MGRQADRPQALIASPQTMSSFATFTVSSADATMARHSVFDTVRVLLRGNRLRTAGIMATILAASAAGSVGVLALLPLLQVVLDTAGTANPGLTRAVNAAFAAVGVEKSVGSLLAFITGVLVLKAALSYFSLRHIGFAAARFMTELRNDLMRAVARARWSFFVRHPLGVISNAMVSEADRASSTYMAFCRFAGHATSAAAFLFACFLVNWRITVVAVVVGGVVALALRRFLRISYESGTRITLLLRSMVSRISDGMHSLKALKAMGQEGRLHDLLRREVKELNLAHQRITTAKGGVSIGQEVAGTVVLAVGAYVALVVYRLDLPQIAVLAALFQRSLGQINLLQSDWQSMLNTESGLWAIMGLIREAEEAEEGHQGTVKAKLSNAIEFDKVDFAYGETPVLRRVSLVVPARKMTVVVGPSGAGKTTLIDLICRLNEPTAGAIRVDGTPIEELDRDAWRAGIGYVPQDVPLFHDSIRQNVTLADTSIGEDRVRLALERAGAWEFVQAMDGQLDAPVGERGGRLSGGQRQRIAIARAMVRDPQLLILDEPTAALDEATERALCETLAGLARFTTVLAISHRPALVEVADEVFRIEEGCVIDTPPAAVPAAISAARV